MIGLGVGALGVRVLGQRRGGALDDDAKVLM